MYIPPAIVTDGLAVASVFSKEKRKLDAALEAFFKKPENEIRKAINALLFAGKDFKQ